MNYKMIAVDLDDTLLDDNLEISKGNLKAIEIAHELGVKIVFCTGRPIKSVIKYVNLINSFKENDYFITFNGALITSIKGEVLFKSTIPKKSMNNLISIGRKNKVNINLYSDEDLIVEKYNSNIKRYEKLTGMSCKVVNDLMEVPYTYKVLFHSEDIALLNEIKKQIDNEYNDFLVTFFSKPNFLEILNANSNKGLAVKYLADHLNIDRKEVIAMGDSYNDIFMIEYAGKGICIKNGNEDIKKAADYVTNNTNNESALLEIVNKFLIEKN